MSRSRLVFVSFSLTTVFFVASTTMLAANNREGDDGNDSLYKYLSVFTEVLGLVNRAYVDELEPAELMGGAFEGAIDALDPFSLYIPADQAKAFERARAVGNRHSGITVLKERGVAYAVAVEEGSPAARAQIKGGSILSTIQGQRTRQTPLITIQEILAGSAGTEIEVERILPQGQKQTVRFELALYDPPAVELGVHQGIGVLRLPAFQPDTAASVETSLRTLTSGSEALPELTENSKLLVDLRGVAGGDAAAAYKVAGLFAKGELGALIAREDTLEAFDGGDAALWEGKIAILVDRGTQGAAEVLATVLRQSAGAALVGERSFGHSGRQRLMELSNGGRLQVTDAFYTGPDRKPINKSLEPDLGIRASIAEPETEDEAPTDEVLERGLEFLLTDEEIEEQAAA